MKHWVWRAAGLACLLPFAALARSPLVVQTAQGKVQGTVAGTVDSWLGVPYAAPPIGALRWREPQPPPSFSGVLPTVSFGASCPQTSDSQPTDESCLFLNIYAPAGATDTSKLPVMVWVHGGSFTSGQGSDYDATTLVEQADVVVVTINYRLGLLGFMAHPAFAAEDRHGSSGDYGFQDQQAAVTWVKANIAGFGGNSRQVTLFGESAGGLSVQSQLTSPGMPALHGAIIESGSYSTYLPTLATAEKQGVTVATALQCGSGADASTAACLRATTPSALLAQTSQGSVTIGPNVDGYTLPIQPTQALGSGAFQHVPIILGSNHDEYRLFVSLDDLRGHPTTDQGYTAEVDATFGPAAPSVLAAYPSSGFVGSAYPCAVTGDASACAPGYALAALFTDYAFACTANLIDGLMAQYTTVYSYEFNEPDTPNVLPYDAYMPDLGDYHTSELLYVWPNLASSTVPLSSSQLVLARTMRAYWTSFADSGAPSAARSAVWPAFGSRQFVMSLVSTGAAVETNFVSDHQCAFWQSIL